MKPQRGAVTAWIIGLLALTAVVAVVLRLTELEALVRVLRGVRPSWLLAGLALQCATYVCAARIWQLALASQDHRITLRRLVPMAIAMLFANQAFPSAGIAGSVVVVGALRRRGVPAPVAMAALLVGLVTTYHALLVAVLAALALLGALRVVDARILAASGLFALAAVGVPAFVFRSWHHMPQRWRTLASRVPALARALHVMETTPTDLLRDRGLWLRTVSLQLIEMLFDVATLQVMVWATGVSLTPGATFGSYVIASALTRVVPVPLGLGTFEGSLVTMLHLVGVPLEAALAATLLFRGFTMWLPMLPGLWLARAEL